MYGVPNAISQGSVRDENEGEGERVEGRRTARDRQKPKRTVIVGSEEC
jgi:hypothetical protein